jgi:hypothetical protein
MAFPEWTDRLSEDVARDIRDNGEFVSDGCHVKDCFWRGYRHKGKCYVGLCDDLNIWETDEKTMLSHCTSE